MRWAFVVVGVANLLTFVPTWVWSNHTATRFAWAIKPPLTAAFMGAGYVAAAVLAFLAARERFLAHARIAIPVTVVFSLLTLAATFAHFDRFFTDRLITWLWVVLYAAVPSLLIVFALRQLRTPGGDPPREAPLPRWARAVLGGQGLILLTLGTALYAAPQTVDVLWPWSLSALTGRIVGAWLVGLGLAALHGVWEGDWRRLRPGAASYTTFAALQLVNVARYPHTLDWGDIRAWLYVLFAVSMVAFGLELSRRAFAAALPDAPLAETELEPA
jgi:hypothetical protein